MNPEFFGSDVVRALLNYVFYYPFLAAYVWMAGGIAHALVFERGRHRRIDPLPLLPERPWSA